MPSKSAAERASDMRSLINVNVPTWDGKVGLAAIFIIGYYVLVFVLVLGTGDLPTVKADIVRDAMLTLGPPIGVIVGALFRSTAADERFEALRSAEMQTAMTTQPAGGDNGSLGDNVEDGARKGAREGVEAGLDRGPPKAADGRPREWLDESPPPPPPVGDPAVGLDASPADPAAVPAMGEEE